MHAPEKESLHWSLAGSPSSMFFKQTRLREATPSMTVRQLRNSLHEIHSFLNRSPYHRWTLGRRPFVELGRCERDELAARQSLVVPAPVERHAFEIRRDEDYVDVAVRRVIAARPRPETPTREPGRSRPPPRSSECAFGPARDRSGS